MTHIKIDTTTTALPAPVTQYTPLAPEKAEMQRYNGENVKKKTFLIDRGLQRHCKYMYLQLMYTGVYPIPSTISRFDTQGNDGTGQRVYPVAHNPLSANGSCEKECRHVGNLVKQGWFSLFDQDLQKAAIPHSALK